MNTPSGLAATPIPTRLRASEKVRRFLQEQLSAQTGETGGRLPTIKEISDHLNVSAFTVHAVVSSLSKRGEIVTIPGRGLFAKDPGGKKESGGVSQPILLTSIHEAEFMGPAMTWGKEICAAILREITNGSDRVMMRPFFVDKMGGAGNLLVEEVRQCQAAIVFPSPVNSNLLEECRRQGKPVIHITAPKMDSTSQFVALNNYAISSRIATCWLKAGRRNVAVLLHHLLEERGECAQTLMGFQVALQKVPAARLHYESLVAEDPEAVDKCMERLWSGSSHPDAIYSTSNGIVTSAISWLLKHHVRIPKEVSLMSGSGIQPEQGEITPHTTLRIPFHQIGAEAVHMALAAMKNIRQLQPGVVLAAGVQPGATTTEKENQLFAAL